MQPFLKGFILQYLLFVPAHPYYVCTNKADDPWNSNQHNDPLALGVSEDYHQRVHNHLELTNQSNKIRQDLRCKFVFDVRTKDQKA
jgi:hypothetical protein